jgi:DivIVA domain-containing protein
MPLTPLDAEKARFRQAFRGYARDDVESFRTAVVSALEGQIARIEELTARVAELEKQLKRYRESEELLKDSVVLAQRTCDELIAAAHKRADAIKNDARSEGQRIRLELSELRAQREQFEYAFHGLLSGFLHRLEQGNPQLAARVEPPQLTSGAQLAAEQPGRSRLSDEPEVGEMDLASPELRAESMAEAGGVADEPAAAAERVRRSSAIPDVPAPRPPRVPGVPSSGRGTAEPAGAAATQVDRDTDIAEFTAAVERAASSSSAESRKREHDESESAARQEIRSDSELDADAGADA